MTEQTLRVLLADDETELREGLATYLRQMHAYHVDTAAHAKSVMTQLIEQRGVYDVLLIDDLLVPEPDQEPEPMAAILTGEIKARYPHIEIIVFTGRGMKSALGSLQAGAYRYLTKPLNFDELDFLIQTAVEHRQLKGAAQEKQILEQLMKTSPALLNGRRLNEVLDTILQGVQACGFDRVRLYLLSDDKKFMVGNAQVGLNETFIGFQMPVDDNIHTQSLLTNPRPHLFRSEDEQPVPYAEMLEKEDVTEWADIPLILHGKIIGKLSIDNKFSQRPISEAGLRPLVLFASQAAAVIENTKLREREEKASKRAAQKTANLKTLQQSFTTINSVLDLDTILKDTCRSAVELFGVDHSGLVLFDTPEYGHVKAEYPDIGALGLKIPIKGIPAEEALIKEKKPIILSDIADKAELGPVYEIWQKLNINSVLVVPIVSKDKVLGSFSLDAIKQCRKFTAEDAETCKVFADQVAVAIENARTLENTKRRNEQLEFLDRITTKIGASLDLDRILQITLEDGLKAVRASEGVITLLNPISDELEVKSRFINGQFIPDDWSAKMGEGITGYVAETGKPYNCPDISKDHRFLRTSTRKVYCSLLCVPITSHGRVLGTLSAFHKQAHFFQPEDGNVLSTLANHVAISIESQRLNDISSVLSTLSLDDMLTKIAESACVLTGTQYSDIFLFDEMSGVIAWGAKFPATREARPLPRQAGGLTDLVTKTGEPVLVSDAQSDPRVKQSVKEEGVQSLMGVPLKIRSGDKSREGVKTIGALFVDAMRSRAFNNRDLELLQSLASQAATAIEKTRLHDQVRQERDSSEQMAAQLVGLHAITQKMQTAVVLPDLLNLIAHLATTLLKGDSGCILLLDEQEQHLTIQGAFGLSQKMVDGTRDQVGTSIAGRVVQDRNPRIENNIPKSALFYNPAAAEEGILAIISTPLWIDGQIIGTLDVHSKTELYAFADDGLQILSMMAMQAAVAIQNSRLYQEKNRREQLLTALDEALRSIRAEKETAKLLQEIVRLAAELIGCRAGGLFINRPNLTELELKVTYNLTEELIGKIVPHSQGIAGLVAKTGSSQVVYDYPIWSKQECIFADYSFETVIGLPLKHTGETEAVLFIIENDGKRLIHKTDLDILERFAAQASIALHTSKLLSQEARIFSHLSMLHKISDYIQTNRDLEKILHVVLTGITAGYGLGFNRAAIFLLDENQEHLVGHMGIGQLKAEDAWQAWDRYHHLNQDSFSRYLDLLEQGTITSTPIGKRIQKLELSLDVNARDVLTQVAIEGHFILAAEEEFGELPKSFIRAFAPAVPFIVVPLLARDRIIGLLVADNKFTRIPITKEDINILLTFADTAAIAIDNSRLFHETQLVRERLSSFYRASNAFVSAQYPEKVLNDIVEQASLAANASGASFVLIDQISQVRYLITAGKDKFKKLSDLVRPNGLSMKVMRSGRPEVINDARKERERVNPSVFWRGIMAAICLPVSLAGKRIGVMWIHYDKARHFTNAEIEAIQLIVNQAGVAYENARRMKELEYMRRAAEALASVASPRKVLRQIVNSACEVLNADSASILYYNASQHKFTTETSLTAFGPAVASGIPRNSYTEHLKDKPWQSQTDFAILKKGWIGVYDIESKERHPDLDKPTREFLRSIGARSFQGMALKAGDDQFGILYVNYKQPRYFSQEEQATARTFANHAFLALNKAKTLDRDQRIRQVAQLVAKVTALDNLQATLNQVVQGMQDALVCDAVTLYTYPSGFIQLNEDIRKRQYSAQVGINYPEKMCKTPKPVTASALYKILKRRNLYWTDDAQNNRLIGGSFAKREQVVSAAGIPLRVKSSNVGVMFVNYRTVHRFTRDELDTIRFFADQVVVAIRNAQLYENVQKRARALKALYDASRAVTSSLKLEELLAAIAKQAWELTGGADKESVFSCLALVYGDQLAFEAAYPSEQLPRLQNQIGSLDLTIDKKMGITCQAVRTQQSQLVHDVTQNQDYIEYDPNTRSELAVPIKLGDAVIGVISTEHPDYHAFDEEDQQALESLAAQAAISIQQSRLYQEKERQAQEMAAIARISQVISTSLDLETTLNAILTSIRSLTDYSSAEICLWDEASQSMIVRWEAGDTRYTRQAGGIYALGEGYSSWIAEHSEPLLIKDSFDYPEVKPKVIDTEQPIRSYLGIPLKVNNALFGTLELVSHIPNVFDEEDKKLLTIVGRHAVTAIQNARLFEKTERHARLLEAAAKVARDTASILDEKRLLNETVNLIVQYFQYFYHASVFLVDRKGQFAELKAASSDIGQRMIQEEFKLKVGQQGIVGFVTQTGQARLAVDVHNEEPYYYPNPLLPDTKAEITFPLIAGDEVIGALDMQSTNVVDLRSEDITTLQTLADQLAKAIHNAQLYQQRAKRLAESDMLQQVAVRLTGAATLTEVLTIVMSEVIKPTNILTNIQESCILLWDPKTEIFTQTYRMNKKEELKPYHSRVRSQGRARDIIDTRRPSAIADAQNVKDFNPAFYERGNRATLGVPLLNHEDAIGVFYLQSKNPYQFSDREIALAQALAGQAAIAIARARQFEELKHTKGLVGVRTAVAWMGMVSSAWQHTIVNDATTIEDRVKLTQMDLESGASGEILHKRLEDIAKMASKIRQAPFTAPLSTEEGVGSVSINELIQERTKQLWKRSPYESVDMALELKLSDAATVRTSRDWLRRALDLIIDNAVKVMTPSPIKKLMISSGQANNGAEIIICDTGPGVPEEIRPYLFQKRIEKTKGSEGLGMGLLMAQTIIHTYEGEIHLHTTGPQGTAMRIWLPLEN